MATLSDQFQIESWDNYIGQDKMKERLQLNIDGSMERDERIDHIFLHGPPGSGKTTLARLVADYADQNYTEMMAPFDEQAMKRLISMEYGVVLIDEFHRFSNKDQERWLGFLVNGTYMTKLGNPILNPDLTVIAATTERGAVIDTIFERFPIRPEFDPYTEDQMTDIARGMLGNEDMALEFEDDSQFDEYARAFAIAASGIPRSIGRFVLTMRDLAKESPSIDRVLDMCDTTRDGLGELHVRYLTALHKNGGQMGAENMKVILQLSGSMLKQIEGLFVTRGWIEWTSKGRVLTGEGYKRMLEMRQ